MLNNHLQQFLEEHQMEGLEIMSSQNSWIIKFKNWLGYHRHYGEELPNEQDKFDLIYELGLCLATGNDVLLNAHYEIITDESELCWLKLSFNSESIILEKCIPHVDYLQITQTEIPKSHSLDFYIEFFTKYPKAMLESKVLKDNGLLDPLEHILLELSSYKLINLGCKENDMGDRFCHLFLESKNDKTLHTLDILQVNFTNEIEPDSTLRLEEIPNLWFDNSFLPHLKAIKKGTISKFIDRETN